LIVGASDVVTTALEHGGPDPMIPIVATGQQPDERLAA
jgi:hypothetical protein